MNMVNYIMTDNSVTVMLNGKSYSFRNGDASFGVIRNALRDGDYDAIVDLVDKPKAVSRYSDGVVTVSDGVVYYGNEAVNNTVVDRILKFMAEGLPVTPLVNFLKKLMQNPSKRSVEQLYKFLENKSLPITPEGDFLAYKAIQSDWYSKTSGTTGKLLNKIGMTVTMPRNKVQDDPNVACSYGLHAGSLEYVNSFASGDDRKVIVQINPADVVSVPSDSNCQKLRTSKYKVVAEFVSEMNESPAYEVETATATVKPLKRDSKGRFVRAKAQMRDASGRFTSVMV